MCDLFWEPQRSGQLRGWKMAVIIILIIIICRQVVLARVVETQVLVLNAGVFNSLLFALKIQLPI